MNNKENTMLERRKKNKSKLEARGKQEKRWEKIKANKYIQIIEMEDKSKRGPTANQ